MDTLTGKNPGNNLGDDFPYFHFEEWEEDYLKVDLMLKGGGCENVGAQYSLPDTRLDANRDLEGVRRTVLDAVQQAQGMGCAPAVIGVAVGGDRARVTSSRRSNSIVRWTTRARTRSWPRWRNA